MLRAVLMALTLGSPPGPPPTVMPPTFADQIDHVDVSVSDDDALVTAFNQDGEPVGSLALWVTGDGMIWIASDYADGISLVGIDPATEEISRFGDLTDAVFAERAELLLLYIDALADQQAKKPSWWRCGRYISCPWD